MDRYHGPNLVVISEHVSAKMLLAQVLSEHLKKAITVAIGVFQARSMTASHTRAGTAIVCRARL